MGLDHGTQTQLIVHLDAAIKLLSHGPKFVTGSCLQLAGFTRQVELAAQVDKLTEAQALQLLNAAQAIETALGCR